MCVGTAIISTHLRHIGDDKGRTYELEQSAVKCLRGILYCYMRQAKKASSLVQLIDTFYLAAFRWSNLR